MDLSLFLFSIWDSSGWGSIKNVRTSQEVFCGYLMLDAWISNQDRHYENWGYIITRDGTVHLAPTFDHASSLGRNEQDSVMKERLTTNDSNRSVESYVRKAKSQIYYPNSVKLLTTIDAFHAWAVTCPKAAISWLQQLEMLDDEEIKSLVHRIPPSFISNVAVDFALEILKQNKKRLIDLKKELK